MLCSDVSVTFNFQRHSQVRDTSFKTLQTKHPISILQRLHIFYGADVCMLNKGFVQHCGIFSTTKRHCLKEHHIFHFMTVFIPTFNRLDNWNIKQKLLLENFTKNMFFLSKGPVLYFMKFQLRSFVMLSLNGLLISPICKDWHVVKD